MKKRGGFDYKAVVVLDNVDDIESVIAKYKKKGWLNVSFRQLHGKPRSVEIGMERVKSQPG